MYIGTIEKDRKTNRDWLVGSFIEGGRHSTGVEIKYWDFPVGETNHQEKTCDCIEITLILKGSCMGTIGGQPYFLSEGNYFVIEPGLPNNLPIEVFEPIVGITIKSPSNPSNTHK